MTGAARLLLMSGLTFHSGRRLADHPELLAAIEAEAVVARDAEIAAAVRGLDCHCAGSFATGHTKWCILPAVLAIIETP